MKNHFSKAALALLGVAAVSASLTSCIDTDEPLGIVELRKAKAGYIQADSLYRAAEAAKTDALTAAQLIENEYKKAHYTIELAKEKNKGDIDIAEALETHKAKLAELQAATAAKEEALDKALASLEVALLTQRDDEFSAELIAAATRVKLIQINLGGQQTAIAKAQATLLAYQTNDVKFYVKELELDSALYAQEAKNTEFAISVWEKLAEIYSNEENISESAAIEEAIDNYEKEIKALEDQALALYKEKALPLLTERDSILAFNHWGGKQAPDYLKDGLEEKDEVLVIEKSKIPATVQKEFVNEILEAGIVSGNKLDDYAQSKYFDGVEMTADYKSWPQPFVNPFEITTDEYMSDIIEEDLAQTWAKYYLTEYETSFKNIGGYDFFNEYSPEDYDYVKGVPADVKAKVAEWMRQDKAPLEAEYNEDLAEWKQAVAEYQPAAKAYATYNNVENWNTAATGWYKAASDAINEFKQVVNGLPAVERVVNTDYVSDKDQYTNNENQRTLRRALDKVRGVLGQYYAVRQPLARVQAVAFNSVSIKKVPADKQNEANIVVSDLENTDESFNVALARINTKLTKGTGSDPDDNIYEDPNKYAYTLNNALSFIMSNTTTTLLGQNIDLDKRNVTFTAVGDTAQGKLYKLMETSQALWGENYIAYSGNPQINLARVVELTKEEYFANKNNDGSALKISSGSAKAYWDMLVAEETFNKLADYEAVYAYLLELAVPFNEIKDTYEQLVNEFKIADIPTTDQLKDVEDSIYEVFAEMYALVGDFASCDNDYLNCINWNYGPSVSGPFKKDNPYYQTTIAQRDLLEDIIARLEADKKVVEGNVDMTFTTMIYEETALGVYHWSVETGTPSELVDMLKYQLLAIEELVANVVTDKQSALETSFINSDETVAQYQANLKAEQDYYTALQSSYESLVAQLKRLIDAYNAGLAE